MRSPAVTVVTLIAACTSTPESTSDPGTTTTSGVSAPGLITGGQQLVFESI